jgi:hypothetical protein
MIYSSPATLAGGRIAGEPTSRLLKKSLVPAAST